MLENALRAKRIVRHSGSKGEESRRSGGVRRCDEVVRRVVPSLFRFEGDCGVFR